MLRVESTAISMKTENCQPQVPQGGITHVKEYHQNENMALTKDQSSILQKNMTH